MLTIFVYGAVGCASPPDPQPSPEARADRPVEGGVKDRYASGYSIPYLSDRLGIRWVPLREVRPEQQFANCRDGWVLVAADC